MTDKSDRDFNSAAWGGVLFVVLLIAVGLAWQGLTTLFETNKMAFVGVVMIITVAVSAILILITYRKAE